MPAVKIKVIRPASGASSGARTPELEPRSIERLRAAPRGLALEPPGLGTIRFDQLRFLGIFQHPLEPGSEEKEIRLLLFAAGHARPLWTAPERIDLESFALSAATSPVEGLRRLARLLCQRCPELHLDRATFAFLGAGEPAPLPGPLAGYVSGVAVALERLAAAAVSPSGDAAEPRDDAAESIDAAAFFEIETENEERETVRPAPAAAPRATTRPLAPMEILAETITCPHCGQSQEPAEKCRRCGAVFAKLAGAPYGVAGIPGTAGAGSAGRTAGASTARGPAADVIGTRRGVESPSRWGVTFLAGESVAELLLALLRDHVMALMAIATVAVSPALLWTAICYELSVSPWVTALAGVPLALFGYSLGVMAVIYYVHYALEGRSPTVGEALAQAARRLPAVLPSRLLALLRVLLGLVALIVPGVVYALRSAFIEILAVLEPADRSEVTRGQISRNLVAGAELSLLAQLILFTLAGGALAAAPIYLAALLNLLGLELLAPLDSLAFRLFLVLAVTALTSLVLAGFAIVLYVFYRELRDQHGRALYLGAEGVDPLTRFVFVTDLILLLLLIFRTSGLVQ